jgi:hypothetical protein
MATHEEKPWWELAGEPPPHEARFDEDRERLRAERARNWRAGVDERERRRARTSVPPPGLPPTAPDPITANPTGTAAAVKATLSPRAR